MHALFSRALLLTIVLSASFPASAATEFYLDGVLRDWFAPSLGVNSMAGAPGCAPFEVEVSRETGVQIRGHGFAIQLAPMSSDDQCIVTEDRLHLNCKRTEIRLTGRALKTTITRVIATRDLAGRITYLQAWRKQGSAFGPLSYLSWGDHLLNCRR